MPAAQTKLVGSTFVTWPPGGSSDRPVRVGSPNPSPIPPNPISRAAVGKPIANARDSVARYRDDADGAKPLSRDRVAPNRSSIWSSLASLPNGPEEGQPRRDFDAHARNQCRSRRDFVAMVVRGRLWGISISGAGSGNRGRPRRSPDQARIDLIILLP